MPRPPAPGSLAPGLPPSHRPAPGRLLAVIALAVLLIAAAAPAVSAEVLINDDLVNYVDTSVSFSQDEVLYTHPYDRLNYNTIYIKKIENQKNIAYFALTVKSEEGLASNFMTEGRHEITYTVGEITDTCIVYCQYSKNILGSIDYATYLIFPQNWNMGTKTGKQYIIFSEPLLKNDRRGKTIYEYNSGKVTTDIRNNYDIGLVAKTSSTYTNIVYLAGSINTISAASAQEWRNNLLVEIGILDLNRVVVTREYEGQGYESIISLVDNGTTVFQNGDVKNFEQFFPPTTPFDTIVLTDNVGKDYTYYIGNAGAPSSPASSVSVYIQNSQTGALLANAHLSILAAVGGTETEVVNQTLPGGTGTFSLEKADYLKYHATATAPGYTLLSPIIFGVPEGGTTIALWMAPDAPPDEPIEEGKSMLYGYAMTQGSQQPIPGATVFLDGYGSRTTSSTGFYLFNNVTPGTYDISASAPLHDALSEPVTVDAAPTQHNLALKGHFLLTVFAKDADDLTNLHNTTISLSDGQESTQNPATFTADYGPYTITAAAGGYYPQTQSAYLDKPGTTTATVLLTAKPEPVPPPEMPNYPPHNVKFTVQTIFGTPIPGVNVTAQGIQQTPSTNILEALLGLNMTSTPINSELMSGTTDTNGEINFMMVEAVKYQISIYKPDVVNQTLEIYPKEDTYPIIISTAGGPLLPDAGDALRDIRINVTTSTEGDTGHILVDYNDTTRKTTSLTIQVTQQNTTDSSAPEEIIASHTVAPDANVTHTFDLSVYKGQSFFVRLEAEHPDFGTVHRDYAVAFKGVRVPLGPLPDGLYIYVAGFGLMLLGGIFGATSATRGVVVIAFAGWLFWGFGWLDDLGLIAPVSLGLVSTLAVMGVIVTRYREEGYT